MTTLHNITLEVGNLTEFTGTATDAGDLSAAAGAALHGSYGLSSLIDDVTDIYGYKDVAAAAAGFRYRFYFDPNTISMPDGGRVTINKVIQASGSFANITYLDLYYFTATGYRFRFRAYNDAGTAVIDDTLDGVSDAPHYIEVKAARAATSVSADGAYEWWVDGVSQGSVASVDNFNRISDPANWRSVIGAVENITATVAGTIYHDDYILTDTPTTTIGAAGWANIAKINGVASSSISKVDGTAVASISKVNGVAV